MRCPTHDRDFIGSCMWCGKQLCKECVAKVDGKKLYCRNCAAQTDVIRTLGKPSFPERRGGNVSSELDKELGK